MLRTRLYRPESLVWLEGYEALTTGSTPFTTNESYPVPIGCPS
ncbi:hypothetical protein [Streptomyces sp. A1547]|nr:hypothetical protein [Streptomyces sp. A1547]